MKIGLLDQDQVERYFVFLTCLFSHLCSKASLGYYQQHEHTKYDRLVPRVNRRLVNKLSDMGSMVFLTVFSHLCSKTSLGYYQQHEHTKYDRLFPRVNQTSEQVEWYGLCGVSDCFQPFVPKLHLDTISSISTPITTDFFLELSQWTSIYL